MKAILFLRKTNKTKPNVIDEPEWTCFQVKWVNNRGAEALVHPCVEMCVMWTGVLWLTHDSCTISWLFVCNSSMLQKYCIYTLIVAKLSRPKFPNQSVSDPCSSSYWLSIRACDHTKSTVDTAIRRPWCPPCLSTGNWPRPSAESHLRKVNISSKPQPTSQITVWVSDHRKHHGAKRGGASWKVE